MRDLEKGALGGVRPPIGDAAYLTSRLNAVEAERSVQSDEERVLAIQNRIQEQINAHREGRRTQEQLSGTIFGLADEQHAISGLKGVLPEPQEASNAGTVPADMVAPKPRRKIIV
jgi:hypothetical protein